MILFLLTSVVAKTRIMLISDPHVMGPGLLIKKGDAWEDAIYYDRKLTEYTRDIYDEMIAVALREKPDLFLISGDLTKDGEMVSHEYVAEKLQLLNQAGIKPFVIPGNHDLGTDEACYYDGGYCDNVLDVADANSFAELYRDFGYGDDVERDEH
jgi:DNA repair exonuclease SbcCD nuclease subunit